jgi:phosphotransferase system, enzyme I, PtsP
MANQMLNHSTSRLLLNRLRQMMAGTGSARERLDSVVTLIANTMVADVCSIYLRTSAEELELVATEGLLAEAIFQTKLQLDEGLVGQIAVTAQPLAIQDAPRHPAFSYRPETGEDPYHAFMGVPVLRGGSVIGVLVVQNRTERRYTEDEVETLQTVAMVIAEICASDLQANGETGFAEIELRPTRYVTLSGRVVSEGIAVGQARLHDVVVPAAKFFATDPEGEEDRLNMALEELRQSIDRIMTSETSPLWGEPRDVLETFRMLASDPSWADRLREGVRSGLTAEAAVDRARREHRARFEKAKDSYLRERLHDLEDLDNRLLRILGGVADAPTHVSAEGSEKIILVARRLGPAELLEYRDAGLAGLIIEEAGTSSHAAIVARALNLPTISGVPQMISRLEDGDQVILDAEEGRIHLRPDAETLEAYEARLRLRGERQAELVALRDLPSSTRDGVQVELMLNAGLRLDVDQLEPTGAAGVGLFRTEFQFLVSETLPKVSEQIAFYTRVLETVGDKPVLFRTVDLGGDKFLPGLEVVREENPALGVRSIRLALEHRGLFRRQLRALIRASADRPLHLMFPMVTTSMEFLEARDLVHEEMEWTRSRGHDMPTELKVGCMLEVPALAHVLDRLAGETDFISIGTNDLMQFFFAADRNTPQLAERYDMISTSALRFLGDIANTCQRVGLPVSVCGEATGRPVDALALIALGFHRLSMPAAGIGPVKRMVRSVHMEDFRADFRARLQKSNGPFRKELLGLIADHKVQI